MRQSNNPGAQVAVPIAKPSQRSTRRSPGLGRSAAQCEVTVVETAALGRAEPQTLRYSGR